MQPQLVGNSQVPCKACGMPISPQAKACPKCGQPPPSSSIETIVRIVFGLIGGVMLVVLFFWLVGHGCLFLVVR